MIKILSPLVQKEEVEPLVSAGVDEFYCGLLHYKGSMNDRPNNDKFNFSSFGELSKAITMTHKFGKKIFLTINKPSLNLEAAIDQAKKAERIGIDGLIVSNPLLIKRLKDLNLNLELNASCLCAVFNSQSIQFFKWLGIETFHLPRHLGIEHVRMLLQKHPNTRLSVFGMQGMCMNIEAFCQLHYLKEEYFIPCKHFKTVNILGSQSLPNNILDKRINMPKFSCGMCALKSFADMGIYSIKIEGRQLPLQKKITHVSIIKKALDNLETCHNNTTYIGLCKKLFKEHFHEDCETEYCYY